VDDRFGGAQSGVGKQVQRRPDPASNVGIAENNGPIVFDFARKGFGSSSAVNDEPIKALRREFSVAPKDGRDATSLALLRADRTSLSRKAAAIANF
jgi:hypothetical protein